MIFYNYLYYDIKLMIRKFLKNLYLINIKINIDIIIFVLKNLYIILKLKSI